MKKTRNRRQKHIPERTCVGCREVLSKKDMVRVVRTEEGVCIDLTGKMPGRGAYLHRQRSCWQNALIRGALAKALKVDLNQESIETLNGFMESLPEQ